MMTIDKFKAAVKTRNVVFVVGTGYSAHSTNRAPMATWRGLMESGIDRVSALSEKPGWADLMRSTISYGFDNNDMGVALSAAGAISSALKSHGEYAFAKWLQETVGSLTCSEDNLGAVLRSLPFPLMTTNYDRLLENGVRPSAVWTTPRDMQQVLSGGSNAVGHLHGVWDSPDSVIFSDEDYRNLLASDAAQEIQRAASTLKSLIYVGYGSGLNDPNFSRMIHWHRSQFIPSGIDHFRLCRNSELDELRITHASDHIHPVAYGDNYGDLPGFLSSLLEDGEQVVLSDAGIARDVVGEVQQGFADAMKTDGIIADNLDDWETRPLSEIVLPPVLLPVPQGDYLRARSAKDPGSRIHRLVAAEEVRKADVIIVAAEENSGLTTAVKWLALEASSYLGGAAPLYVSFPKCRRVGKPLAEQVRIEAYTRELISSKVAAIPPYVLALDDFSPYVEKISDRVIGELGKSEAIFTVIGCQQGMEEELLDRLATAGVKATVRYLGKLSSEDVRKFAKLASPDNAEKLAQQVLDILQSEHLPRTPFTVSLLISVLIRGGALSKNASQTTILDDYVGLLLGRGDPHDDARFGLDQNAREAVLSGLAQNFVSADAAGLVESETVAAIQAIIDRFGWAESPTEILASFLDRRVLRRDGRHIIFARSSFLHLFAAKRAILDSSFRGLLLDKPLRYASAITDYAALYRHDLDLLKAMAELLKSTDWEKTKGTVFEEIDLVEPFVPTRTADDGEDVEDKADQVGEKTNDLEQLDYFDFTDDLDTPPFPVVEESDLPDGLLLFRILELVSSVLRDSDQIEDLAEKQAILVDVLHHWGLAMSTINSDRSFRDFLRQLITQLGNQEDKPEDPEEFLEELVKTLPAAMVFGGLSLVLASRKLIVVLQRAVTAGEIAVTEEASISAAFFYFALKEPGWIAQIRSIVQSQKNVWVVRNFLLYMLLSSYVEDELTEKDRDELGLLCVEIVSRATSYKSSADEAHHREEIGKSIKTDRLRNQAKKKLQANIRAIDS